MLKSWIAGAGVVFAGLGAMAQSARVVYIDPIGSNAPASWNNVSFVTANATALLTDSLTNATGIRVTVTTPLQGPNTAASANPSGAAAEFAPAGANSAFGNTTVWGTKIVPLGQMAFSNLSPGTAYHFTFYASRTGVSDNREARYTLAGANSGSNTLNASGNSTQVTTVSNIFPAADGTATLRIERGANNNEPNGFFYLTAMKLAYTDPGAPPPVPTTTVFVDAAGTSAAAGWNLVAFNAATTNRYLAASTGEATGIGMQILTPLPGTSATGTNNPAGDAAEFAPAGTQTCFGYNANYASPARPRGAALFSGLATNVAYTFTFYASRMGAADDRSALFALTGANSGSNTLSAANNYAKVCAVSNIYPQADGTIALDVTKGPTNNNGSDFFYIGALKLTFETYEFPEPPLPPAAGKRLLFFGNSFSMGDNVPNAVAGLAEIAGHPRPLVVADLMGGMDLAYHIAQVDGYPENNVANAALTGTDTWDHVILQGYSTEATHLRDTSVFRTNALALFRRVKDHASGKGAGVNPVLFQTWARAPAHSFYPGSFPDPAAMQTEIRTNYQAAAAIIAAAEPAADVRLAPVGDAFERGAFDAADLYASDLYHAAKLGPKIAAMVLYKTIYQSAVTNIPHAVAVAAGWTTMSSNDWTRATYWAEGLTPPEVPPPLPPPPLRPGSREVIYVDPVSNNGPAGWNNVSVTAVQEVELAATDGRATAIRMTVVTPARGPNTSVSASPAGAAAPFLPAGANTAYGNTATFSGGVAPVCELRFSGLARARRYTFTFYASRIGADVTDNRETLYTVTGAAGGSATLNAALNSTQVATVAEIAPDADGTITARIEKGPNNTNVYGFFYLTAFRIESQRKGTLFLIGP